MKLRNRPLARSEDGRAVSSVIGVILMVAVTVVIATVIATFVLGVGEKVDDAPPQLEFDFDQDQEEFTERRNNAGTNESIVVDMNVRSGETVEGDNVFVQVNGKQGWDAVGLNESSGDKDSYTRYPILADEIEAGGSFRVMLPNNGLENDTDLGISNAGDFQSDTQSDDLRPLKAGDTITIVYDNPETSDTAILETYEVQPPNKK